MIHGTPPITRLVSIGEIYKADGLTSHTQHSQEVYLCNIFRLARIEIINLDLCIVMSYIAETVLHYYHK